ncbi:hypothetical protein ASE79_05240 [Sphingomonas sp. Leaf28]|nr:hypothetical protein ASE79_05240 [Sphingomonas sp. Leaf28]
MGCKGDLCTLFRRVQGLIDTLFYHRAVRARIISSCSCDHVSVRFGLAFANAISSTQSIDLLFDAAKVGSVFPAISLGIRSASRARIHSDLLPVFRPLIT